MLGTALVIVGIAFVNVERGTLVAGIGKVRSRFGRPPADAALTDAVSPPR